MTLKKMKSMIAGGIIAGVGADIANKAGSTQAAQGISNLASAYPTLGSIYGAKMTLKALKKVKV